MNRGKATNYNIPIYTKVDGKTQIGDKRPFNISNVDIAGIYDKIVLYAGAGALIPITSFGHLLIHGAMDIATTLGPLGLAFGIFDLTSAGISVALFLSFVLALIFKPRH